MSRDPEIKYVKLRIRISDVQQVFTDLWFPHCRESPWLGCSQEIRVPLESLLVLGDAERAICSQRGSLGRE